MDILRDRLLRDRINAEKQAQKEGALFQNLFKLECEGVTEVHNNQMLPRIRDKNNHNNTLLAE
jgi:hypothetical protein